MKSADDPNLIPIGPGVNLPRTALRFTFSRASGPGGQHVNKVSTRATLTVGLDELAAVLPDWALERLVRRAGHRLVTDRIVLSAADSRSQIANRRSCLLKLKHLVSESMRRPRRRRPTRPSARAVQKRLDDKKARGRLKTSRRADRDPNDA